MKIFVIFIFVFCLFFSRYALAQTPPAAAIQLANHIAQKMKDTLDLTVPERNRVYAINIYLHNQKAAGRQQHNGPLPLSQRLQKIESKRDSLYHTILPEDKYLLYKQKKSNLVTSN